MKKKLLIAFFALLFAPLFSRAQGLGSIAGRVTDPEGAAVASAQVTATRGAVGSGDQRRGQASVDGLAGRSPKLLVNNVRAGRRARHTF